MAIFDYIQPKQEFWQAPRRAEGRDRLALALGGYRENGTQNTWGQVSSWIPGVGIGLNRAAKARADKMGLEQVSENIDNDLDNRMAKTQTTLGAGLAVAGAVTGIPQLVGAGVQMGAGGLGTLAGTKKDPLARPETMYFMAGGKPHGEDYRRYTEEEKDQEDMYLVDKQAAEQAGLKDAIEQIKFGEMRYGERIFDQKATDAIDRMVKALGRKPSRQGLQKLGEFVLKETMTHEDMKPQEFRANEDGTFRAADGNKPIPISGLKPMTPRGLGLLTPGIKPISGYSGPTKEAIDAGASMLKKAGSAGDKEGEINWWGVGASALRTVLSGIGASQPLPKLESSPAYQTYLRTLQEQSTQGLLPAERAALEGELARQAGQDVQAIRQTSGGGGSQAAVLGALGAAARRQQAGAVEIGKLDAAQRRQNQALYGQALTSQNNMNYLGWATDYQQAAQNQALYGQAMAANLGAISDQIGEDRLYGKGSSYDELLQRIVQERSRTQAATNRSFTGFGATKFANTLNPTKPTT